MTWIIDASAAVELVLAREHSRPIGMILQDADEVLAPEIFVAEVANVYWKYHRFEELPKDAYYQYAKTTIELADNFVGHLNILDLALEIAFLYEVTVYDAMYLGLSSMITESGIISIDKKLRRAAIQMKIPVNHM